MPKKTVLIDNHLYNELKNQMESIRKENYRKQIAQMAHDPIVQSDIKAIEEDFISYLLALQKQKLGNLL